MTHLRTLYMSEYPTIGVRPAHPISPRALANRAYHPLANLSFEHHLQNLQNLRQHV